MGYEGGKLHPWFQQKPVDFVMRTAPPLVAEEGRQIAEKNTPVDTGKLRERWAADKRAKRTIGLAVAGWRASWYNDSEYAGYVNYGTGLYGPEHRKYLILPKKPGGTLHWVDKATGKDIFASSVMHPGSPGNYMLEISADTVEATWQKVMKPVLKSWATMMENQNPYAT